MPKNRDEILKIREKVFFISIVLNFVPVLAFQLIFDFPVFYSVFMSSLILSICVFAKYYTGEYAYQKKIYKNIYIDSILIIVLYSTVLICSSDIIGGFAEIIVKVLPHSKYD